MKIVIIIFLLFGFGAMATPLVEVESNLNPLQTYNERNHKVSKLFSLGVGYWQPYGFESQKDNNTFSNLFGEGEQINSPEISLWLRRKFAYLDWGIGLTAGTGKITSNKIGEEVTMNLQYSGLKLGLWLNQIFDEPYIVPFFTVQQVNLSLNEISAGQTVTQINTPSTQMRIGLQIQLNWIEWLSSNRALASFGLQNTFLEGFYQISSNTANNETLFDGGDQTGLALSLEF